MVLLSVELSILFELDFCFEKGYFKGEEDCLDQVSWSRGSSEGSDLILQHCFDLGCTLLLEWCRDKYHWGKKKPKQQIFCIFFTQNILNSGNVKIFSKTLPFFIRGPQ